MERLIAACAATERTPVVDPVEKRIIHRRIFLLKKDLETTAKEIPDDPLDDVNICLLEQLEGDMLDHKRELGETCQEILALELYEHNELNTLQSSLQDIIFDSSLKICKLLHLKCEAKSFPQGKGVKLPKIDVPKFNGDVLNWQTFWEQFNISVHNQDCLLESEKLVYLQHSLSEGSAKHVIEGLSRMGECYDEAVKCLRSRYDRPRLIHQTHVRKIMDAPLLKDGSGKELQCLHDTVQQHLRH